MNKVDITLLTDGRYLVPKPGNAYVENIFEEDRLLGEALRRLGLSFERRRWDDPDHDWRQSRFAVFRTTWDYFDRFGEFDQWLDRAAAQTCFINDLALVRWNMDKHYLGDLERQGLPVVPTIFIPRGSVCTLSAHMELHELKQCILKPTISGAGRHTYLIQGTVTDDLEAIFQSLISQEDMMLQPFLRSVLTEGETTVVFFGHQITHGVRKRAKSGDFRVQDDFGGTVHAYTPSSAEVEIVQRAIHACPQAPVYGRVDFICSENGDYLISEMELIEPELWMRNHPESAGLFAEALHKKVAGLG